MMESDSVAYIFGFELFVLEGRQSLTRCPGLEGSAEVAPVGGWLVGW